MPEITDIQYAKDIGKKGRYIKYIWNKCPRCGLERWVSLREIPLLCNHCAIKSRGTGAHNWKGGRVVESGYIAIRLQPDDFFYPMVDGNGYVKEHRLVMAKSIGRCLHDWEIVHHKNHNRIDNHLENLQLVTDDRHTQITLLESKIAHLEKEVKYWKNKATDRVV